MTLSTLIKMFVDAGIRRLLVKELAENDNSKNQVYLGSNFEAVNLLPTRGITADVSGKSRIFKAKLDFKWIDVAGIQHNAPGTQLILYPQYPEVRMSGFLSGCRNAPSDLMASRIKGRLLFLGITEMGTILGHVVGPDVPVCRELVGRSDIERAGIFRDIPLDRKEQEDSRTRLIRKLAEIHHKGWIDSKKLGKGGIVVPCKSSNCGGYTLEAELGVTANGYSDPDIWGWEIKQHAVTSFDHLPKGVITLMTPNPTGGWYASKGVESFVRKFGYRDRMGRADRWNFGGLHKVEITNELTGLHLSLRGYDPITNRITDPAGGLVLATAEGVCAAEWNFSGLMSHWNRKHAQAAYIPSLKREAPKWQYRYGRKIHMGNGTDFLRFLRAMSDGQVYYDPGIKLEKVSTPDSSTKGRSQFRIKFSALKSLYQSFEEVDTITSLSAC